LFVCLFVYLFVCLFCEFDGLPVCMSSMASWSAKKNDSLAYNAPPSMQQQKRRLKNRRKSHHQSMRGGMVCVTKVAVVQLSPVQEQKKRSIHASVEC